jgi:hypothetical protein
LKYILPTYLSSKTLKTALKTKREMREAKE